MKLEKISLAELQALWPATDEGRLCARLLIQYGFTFLVDSSLGAQCTAERAQAESGAAKAVAKMIEDFGTLGAEAPAKKVRKPLAPLHRFQTEQQKQQQPPNPET